METKPRILVVEDDGAVSGFLSAALADEGYEVTTANNGWTGLTLIESLQPDLILLDMYMPVLDGWDFIAVYRDSPQSVPIIGISAMRGGDELAKSLGLSDFVAKPFSLDDLLDRIARCLST